jgi:tetratricopeptide (TPR) repeat protein
MWSASTRLDKRGVVGALLLALVVTATFGAGTARAADHGTNQLEMKARESFAAGRYDEALQTFAKLYAETLHPVYLRNIGRCHQKMREPQKAIDAFKDYLAKSPKTGKEKVSADERAEIEGYIKEMEDLKRQRETPPPPPPPKEDPAPRLHSIAEPPPPHQVISQPPPPPVEESAPVYKRWWFWTAVGVAVVAGTVGVMAATGTFKSSAKDPECGAGRLCQ